MAATDACPERRVLQKLLQGRLPPEKTERLAQHLEQCARCSAAAQTLAAADPFFDTLRAKTFAEQAHSQRVQDLIARLQDEGPPRDAVSDDLATIVPSDSLAGPVSGCLGQLGGYRLLRLLGEGGMGRVFHAEDTALKRSVALKVMKRLLAADTEARARFVREARAAAAVRHDHIVTIYQVGQDGGVPFIAMELLEGESLEAHLKRVAKVPLAEAVRIGREIAEGLAAAHDRRLIHRDIKPANIWLEAREAAGRRDSGQKAVPAARVKILDFGLARDDAASHLTQQGMILGTPAYMAPEQAAGKVVDGRADLFSLGCILYQLCTGTMPFKGKDTMATLLAVTSTHPKPPYALNPQVSVALGKLVMQLLAKNPAERLASAGQLAERLRAFEEQLSRQAQSAKPSAHWTLRHVLFVVIPLTLALVLVGLFGLPSLLRTGDHQPGPVVPLTTTDSLKTDAGARSKNFLPTAGSPDGQETPFVPDRPLGLQYGPVLALAFAPDSRTLAVGCGHADGPDTPGEVSLWDVPSGKVPELRAQAEAQVRCVAFSADGKYLAFATGDWDVVFSGNITIYDMHAGKQAFRFSAHEGGVLCLAFHPRENSLVSGGADGTVKLWNAQTGMLIQTLDGHVGKVNGVAFSPTGDLLATAGEDRTVILWAVSTWAKLSLPGTLPAWVSSVAFDPKGQWLAAGIGVDQSIGSTPLVTLWSIKDKRTQQLEHAQHSVFALQFSVDGGTLVSGCHDGAIWFWSEGKPRAVWPAHEGGAHAISVSSDGAYLATGGQDRNVRIWRRNDVK